MAAFTSLFLVKKGLEDVGRVFNSVCEKGLGKLLETQDCYALDLFAPKTIHERRNCSNTYSCDEFFSREYRRIQVLEGVQMGTLYDGIFE
ncbi:MAG: hypothetical protein WBL63_11595 [Candidatus Acidiferrum sp.]